MVRRETPLDPIAILRALETSNVDYVIIGGVAVQAHGHVRTTQDVDITPDPDPRNIERLAAALRDLGAVPAGSGSEDRDSLDFVEAMSHGRVLELDTTAGGLDVHPAPRGAPPYV